MSSHPHEVPPGWKKGQRLKRMGNARRFALVQDLTTQEAWEDLVDDPVEEAIFAITFDSEADVESFLAWWHS